MWVYEQHIIAEKSGEQPYGRSLLLVSFYSAFLVTAGLS